MTAENKSALDPQKSGETQKSAPGKISIAIVIPNYNHGKLLPTAIESVVTQSRQPDAIYVLDDASKDNSVEVVQQFCERHPNVHLVRREKNLGVFRNINEFVMRLESTFFYVLPADDYMLPGYVEGAYDLLSKYPNAGICTAETLTLQADGTTKIYPLKWSDKPTYLSPKELARVARGQFTGQCFYNSKALQEIGGFPEELRWFGDPFAGWAVAARHGACYLTKPGTAFRENINSYGAAGTRSKEHHNVMLNSMEYLRRPDFADIKPVLRDAHVLGFFDKGLFTAMCRDKRNHYFLTRSFLWMLVWRHVRRRVRHPLPEPIKLWLRERFKSQRTQSAPANH